MNLGDLPGDLGGNHPLATWLNRLKRAVARRTPKPGVGYSVRQGADGVSFVIIPGGGGRGGTAVQIKVATLLSVGGDTLGVRLQDASIVTAYKPYELRQTTNDGLGLNYTYFNGSERDASQNGLFLESQLILPRYVIGGLIWVAKPDYAYSAQTEPDTTYLDLNVGGRAWARKYV